MLGAGDPDCFLILRGNSKQELAKMRGEKVIFISSK